MPRSRYEIQGWLTPTFWASSNCWRPLRWRAVLKLLDILLIIFYNHSMAWPHSKIGDNSGEAVLTVYRIGREGGRLKKRTEGKVSRRALMREAGRLRMLYEKRTKGKIGRRPRPAVFVGEALQRLWPESQIRRGVRSNLEDSNLELQSYEQNKLYRRLHKEIRRAANWDNFRLGHKVFRFIKSSKDGVTVREILLKFSISKHTLENLPMPSPFLRWVPSGRRVRLVFAPPRLK